MDKYDEIAERIVLRVALCDETAEYEAESKNIAAILRKTFPESVRPAPSEDDAAVIQTALEHGEKVYANLQTIPIDGATGLHELFAEALARLAALRAQLATALKELANLDEQINLRMKAEQETAAIKQAVVDTVGGTVEGRPTNTLNYLQRLRELAAEESSQLAEPTKALGTAAYHLDEWAEYFDNIAGASDPISAQGLRRKAGICREQAAHARAALGGKEPTK